MKLKFYRQILEKYLNIKFHENLSSGSRVVPCGRTDRQTYMTKLIVAFRSFANSPKKKRGCDNDSQTRNLLIKNLPT